MKQIHNILTTLLLSASLAACGGGGGGDSAPSNPPVATTPTVPPVVNPTTPTTPSVPTTPTTPSVPTTPTVPPVTPPGVIDTIIDMITPGPSTPTTPTVPPVVNPTTPSVPTTPTVPPVVTNPTNPTVPPVVTNPTTPTVPPVVTNPTVPVVPTVPAVKYMTQTEAARLLQRGTFGGRFDEINSMTQMSGEQWIDAQIKMPISNHQRHVEALIAKLANPDQSTPQVFMSSFYTHSVHSQDQLRQRMAYAYSQIFVVSFLNDNLYHSSRSIASYHDMLARNAFGNFRTILRDVSLHPIMGYYLSHIRNQKADSTGRKPDENFAREVMQLFSIGLNRLNIDGTVVKDAQGNPVPTYTNDDVMELAKVFTGWSFAGPDTSDGRFHGWTGQPIDPDRMVKPMQMYNKFHETGSKTVLGTTIGGGDGVADMNAAIDILFNHPNVGPFIGKQLIQRLVTSNPSPQYVARVARVFNNNGSGVRGDMTAVIKAILLDPEALNNTAKTSGKIREPVLRLTNWLRTFHTKSVSGNYTIGITDDMMYSLNQSPYRSPSVFNFYRPGYVPPNTSLAANGMVAPELQIAHEASVVAYANFMMWTINLGGGDTSPREIQADYSKELPLSTDPAALVNYLNTVLTANGINDSRKAKIVNAVNSVKIPTATNTNSADIETAKQNRVKLAVYMIMNLPEYIVQK